MHYPRMWSRLRRTVACGLTALGIGWLPAPVHGDSDPSCQDLFTPVSVAGLALTMYGRLCEPAKGADTIQVLVPGGTYNSTYWDSPYTPDIRSFRLAMNNAGYATLTVDRLGAGRSSRPPSAVLTATIQADAVHQVIQALRSGVGAPRYPKIILGGHSVGSAITIIEAGTYHDEDAVLVTGLTHKFNTAGAAPIIATLVPAPVDPKFAGQGYDPGYLTTSAGTRYSDFQSPGPYDAGAGAMDESTKDVVATGEMLDTVLIGSLSTYSRLINVPVMVAVGAGDPAFCGLLSADCSTARTLYDSEAVYYSPAAHLTTYVLSDFGHSLNYAPNAPDLHAAVISWANGVIGP